VDDIHKTLAEHDHRIELLETAVAQIVAGDRRSDPPATITYVDNTYGHNTNGRVPSTPDPRVTVDECLVVIGRAHDYLKALNYVSSVAKDEVKEALKEIQVRARIEETR